MKFWRGNKVDAEFDMPVAEVADSFRHAVEHDADWRERYEHWPLERTLRAWLTSPEGLNSVWTDETGPESFDALYDLVRDRKEEDFTDATELAVLLGP